jgi:hypothetical protein
MILRRLKILVVLILIAGCIFPQIGNHCEAREIWINKVVSIAPDGYQVF